MQESIDQVEMRASVDQKTSSTPADVLAKLFGEAHLLFHQLIGYRIVDTS